MLPGVNRVFLQTSPTGRHVLFVLTLAALVIGAVGTTDAQERRREGGRAVSAQPARGANQSRQPSFNRPGGPQHGANTGQHPQFGADRQGFNRQGFNRQSSNRPGFNRPGANRQGFNNRPGFNRPGAFGVARNGLPHRPMIGERGFTGVPPRGETRFLSNEMVFHVGPNVSAQAVDDALRRAGVTSVGSQNLSVTGGRLYHLRINDGRQVADVVRTLEQQNIGTAQPNYVYRVQQDAHALPPGDAAQYAVAKLRLIESHRIATGKNVVVAMIDSRIDAAHPDIAGAITAEFDAAGNRDKPDNHGTGMTGAIVAHQKLLGVAPGVKILAIHAFSPDAQSSAQATSQHILAGIDWAIQNGARIINMSFAGPYDPVLQLALKKAHDKGIVLIAAAGNMGPQSPPLYPAADENVIAVTATDQSDNLLPQANQGAHIALAAPGVNILEPAANSSYQMTTGTSVAAAHVTGVAALIIERAPDIDDATLEEVLTSTAKDLGPKGRDSQFGYGLVDPYRALNALEAKIAAGGSSRQPAPAPALQAATMKPLPRQAQNASTDGVVMASNRMAGSQGNPAPSQTAAMPTDPAAPSTVEADREAARAATEKRRLACRQDGASKQMRGPDLQDYVNVCIAEARVACLKQAVTQQVRGPARRDFLNGCLAGP